MTEPYRYPNTRWNYIKLFGGAFALIAILAYLATSEDKARRACELKHSKEVCAYYVR